jgi:hypothetical protein
MHPSPDDARDEANRKGRRRLDWHVGIRLITLQE